MTDRYRRRAWVALSAALVAMLLASGSRYAFGVFVVPIEQEIGWDRAALSLAAAVNVLAFGAGQVVCGFLVDRFGPRRVFSLGLTLMLIGIVGLSQSDQLWQLFVFYGGFTGIGFAGASIVPAVALMTGWFPNRPAFAVGAASAALPAGQAVFVPLVAAAVPLIGWRMTYMSLAAAVVLIAIPAAWFLAHDPPLGAIPIADGASKRSRPRDWRLIGLISAGFLACGFTDQLVAIHLVPFANGLGFSLLVAAGAQSILTLAGIGGSLISGRLADGWSPRGVLVSIYLTRALTFGVLIACAATGSLTLLYLFAVLFGPTAIANTAPASRLLRERFGQAYVGSVLGMAQFTHQFGAALGISLGGLSFTLLGSYSPALAVASLAAIGGSLASMALPRPSREPKPTPQVVGT